MTRALSAARVSVVLLFAFVTACSGGGPETTESSPASVINLLRDTVHFNHIPYADPSAMRRAVDIAVVGEVSSVEPAVLADEFQGQNVVVIGIAPLETWKAPAGSAKTVYFWFHRPRSTEISFYQQALPAGTKLALFGFDTSASRKFTSGSPPSTAYEPAPQGLYLPTANSRIANVWGQEGVSSRAWQSLDTFEELRAAALR